MTRPVVTRPPDVTLPAYADTPAPGTGTTAGVLLLVGFLFLAYSRVLELLPFSFRLPFILSLVCFVLVIANGGLFRTMVRSPATWLIAYSGWLLIASAFSVWPGGSVTLLRDQWFKSFLVFFIVRGLIETVPDLKLACGALAASSVAGALLLLVLGTAGEEGRMALSAGTLSNPNDVAVHLLLFAPYVWLLSVRSRSLWRIILWTSLAVILVACAKTGSRGGLLALLGMTLYAIVRSNLRQKLRILAAGGIAVFLVGVTVPASVMKRYSTAFFDTDELSDVDPGALDAAQGSKDARIEALKTSLQMTAENPLLGVGPGMYMVAEHEMAEAAGHRSRWQDTHNTFTQVSSEAGVPALWCYGAVLLFSFRASRRVSRAEPSELVGFGTAQTYALLSYLIASSFANFAYSTYLPVLAGLSAAMDDLAARLRPEHSDRQES